jgi:hypothetical protein
MHSISDFIKNQFLKEKHYSQSHALKYVIENFTLGRDLGNGTFIKLSF